MTAPRSVVQIVPRLPPDVDGVGDYGRALARELDAHHRIVTTFIVGHPAGHSPREVDGYAVRKPSSPTAAAMGILLEEFAPGPATIILNFVGYGYDRNGAPFWLLKALQRWKRAGARRRLITMFHELHAFGPPWSRAFWTCPMQRWIVIQLAKLSDRVHTNIRWFANFLDQQVSRDQEGVECLPVFSNVGEPTSNPAFQSRSPRMVVFGSRAWRTQAFIDYHSELTETCRHMGIQEIYDIGAPLGFEPRVGVPVRSTGVLDEREISIILGASRVGFMVYWPHALGKSGVFAAYSAHGVVSVMPHLRDRRPSDVVEGQHYLSARDSGLEQSDRMKRFSEEIFRWYAGHDCAHHAAAFARAMDAVEKQS